MTAFFVTATGTDVGKTFVTTGLVRHLRAQGNPAFAIKPVMSGFDPARAAESDAGALLAAMGHPVTENEIARISPWRFAAPLSPDMAAARESSAIDFDAVVAFCCDAVAHAASPLFIEGVGGIMVPLNDRHTVLDWMAALRIPLLVVTGTYLGTISHTLTALDVLRRRGLDIAALVVNESENSPVPLADTAETMARFAPGMLLATLARAPDDNAFASFARLCGIDPR
jgi:dethiobiotin synthetase